MSGAWVLPDVTLRTMAKQFNLGFIRPENLISPGLRVDGENMLFACTVDVFMCVWTLFIDEVLISQDETPEMKLFVFVLVTPQTEVLHTQYTKGRWENKGLSGHVNHAIQQIGSSV